MSAFRSRHLTVPFTNQVFGVGEFHCVGHSLDLHKSSLPVRIFANSG